VIFKYLKTRNAKFGAFILVSLVLSQPAFAQDVPSFRQLLSRQNAAERTAVRSCAAGSYRDCFRAVRLLAAATIALYPDATFAAQKILLRAKLERVIEAARSNRPSVPNLTNLMAIELVLRGVDPDSSTEPLTLSASPS